MVTVVREVPRVGRVTRRPVHNHHIRCKPWQIQPFMIAPVLAGETMKNLLLQSRVVTDPIKNPLIGWWQEYYYFYVKLTDMDQFNGLENNQATSFVNMLLNDPSSNLAGYKTTALVDVYRYANGVDYVSQALQVVVKDYFRNEDEAWNVATLGNLPLASVNFQSYIDSLVLASALVRPDINVDLNANAAITASEVDTALNRWQWARSNGLTDMSYEDYLSTFGVNISVEHYRKCELVRYVREWTYPTNTVDPLTGAPSSACSWGIQERADKDRFFKEPGFLFGVTVSRPKVYLSGLKGAAVGMMDTANDWLPAAINADAWSALKKLTASTGPAGAVTADYWLDVRDLFLYGDQYINFAMTTDHNAVALPSATGAKRYCSTTDVDALFVNAAGGKNLVRQDGVTQLAILGTQKDLTATT